MQEKAVMDNVKVFHTCKTAASDKTLETCDGKRRVEHTKEQTQIRGNTNRRRTEIRSSPQTNSGKIDGCLKKLHVRLPERAK